MAFVKPSLEEVAQYMKTRKGWPDEFATYYAEKFWNHYQASGWKLSSGNSIKDWQACFNSQWQHLRFKEDQDRLAKCKVVKMEQVKTNNEIGELDKLLAKYCEHPTSVPFSEFGKWYDYMKEQKLLRPFSKTDIDWLRSVHNNDNTKCRCACVQLTFDGYATSGFTFANTMEVRKRLAG